MKKMKAVPYSLSGEQKILRIPCPDDGRMIPVAACRIANCACCMGYTEVRIDDGVEITTMCGWGK